MQRKVRKRRQGCCAYRVDLGDLLEPFCAGSARRDRIQMLLPSQNIATDQTKLSCRLAAEEGVTDKTFRLAVEEGDRTDRHGGIGAQGRSLRLHAGGAGHCAWAASIRSA